MRLHLIAALLAALAAHATGALAAPRLETVGVRLTFSLDGGRKLAGAGLVGLALEVGDEGGRNLSVRLDGALLDPKTRPYRRPDID